jgi:ferritin-like metal-binding protein YciE
LNLGSERAADVLSTVEGSAVEHYKIARYGISRPGPRSLRLNEAVKLLDMTLGEEKKTDETLTKLAETRSTSTREDRRSSPREDHRGVKHAVPFVRRAADRVGAPS